MNREKEKRELHEVVVVTRNCDIGQTNERAVVIALVDHDRYMTLLFPDRAHHARLVHTGSDYRYLRRTVVSREEGSAQ